MLINYSYYNKYARKKIINIDYPCGTAYFYIMDDISLQLLHELSVVSDSCPSELKTIYGSAVETLDLSIIDYLTIRDLVRLSGSNSTALHLLLIALFISLSEGSVRLKLSSESLRKKLDPVAGAKSGEYAAQISGFLDRHSELACTVQAGSPLLFDNPRDAFKPLIRVDSDGGRYVYFHKYYMAENAIQESLAALLARGPRSRPDMERLSAVMRSVLAEKPVRIGGEPALLNFEQKLGILLPVCNNFAIISGGPGTGKTFIVLTLLRVMARLGSAPDMIKIAAPTGRAAQRLTDSIHRGISSIRERDPHDDSLASLQGTTLHRLLRYSPSGNDFFHNKYNRIKADLVIVDEASMIDIVLLGKLFEALDDHACLVMLGDRNQLPSVEAGAVLADLIPEDRSGSFSADTIALIKNVFPEIKGSPLLNNPEHAHDAAHPGSLEDRVVILRESYRSEESIKTIARRINSRDHSVIAEIPEIGPRDAFPEHGVWRIEPEKSGEPRARELRHILNSWAAHHYMEESADGASFHGLVVSASGIDPDADHRGFSSHMKKILGCLDEARILTPVRSGLFGTAGINAHIQGALEGAFDHAGRGGIFSGAPVIITKNDYGRELFNGDVGVIIRSRAGRYTGVFERSGEVVAYPAETLPPFELSYAVTVHKSQGSEYGHVLFIIPEGINDALLTTEILYTGLTRAKNLVILYAKGSVLSQAIQNRTERESGIRF
jgi:exodeoxyribonuclease V alpha subunit